MPPDPDYPPADIVALPALRWVVWPALAALAALLAVELADYNTAGFLAANHFAQWLLPDTAWAAVTLAGSSLGAFALLAPSLKPRPQWLAAGLLAAPLGMLCSQGGKRLFELPRPAGVLEAGRFNVIGEWL
ncbi:MAG: hypothetical protein HGA47_08625, partial [Zoogloea sp.]|nr:hypothetical protein [Zoogloea sp.]